MCPCATWRQVINHIVTLAHARGLAAVYLASDNQSDKFWKYIRAATEGRLEVLPRVRYVDELATAGYPPIKDNQVSDA